MDKLKALSVGYEKVDFPNAQTGSTNIFKRALERTNVGGNGGGGHKTSANASSRPWRKVGSDDVTRVALVCGMYHAALTTLSQLKLDILSGKLKTLHFILDPSDMISSLAALCYNDTLLHDLFLLVASLGPNCGLKQLNELLTMSPAPNCYAPPLQMLLLFCDLMTHYVT